jgi:hypothetical protein
MNQRLQVDDRSDRTERRLHRRGGLGTGFGRWQVLVFV